MAFSLQYSMALSAGVFINAVETTPHVLVWRLDRSQGLLSQDTHKRLKIHDMQVRMRNPNVIKGWPSYSILVTPGTK